MYLDDIILNWYKKRRERKTRKKEKKEKENPMSYKTKHPRKNGKFKGGIVLGTQVRKHASTQTK